MKKNIKELREKYISNPPEGMTSEDIRHMSEDDLLDMDCFLNEDVFGDDFGEEEDGAVTVRDRDTMQQERIKIADLKAYFEDKFRF